MESVFMHFYGTIWRPPYEAWSGLLQVTAGCSHNSCKFCTLYEELPFKFRMSPFKEIEDDLCELTKCSPNIRRLFLVGANPFVLETSKLKNIARLAKQYLRKLDSIGCFARITDISHKTIKELKDLRALGYNKITIGVETGDDEALKFMNKGYTSIDIVNQCRKLDEANIEYNFFYLTGIYGSGNSVKGVENTAQIFNQLNPKIIGASMLTVFSTSKLYNEIQQGHWKEESETEKLQELKLLIENLNINTHFAVLGASNMFHFQGKIPKEKDIMIKYIDEILANFGEEDLKSYRNNLNHL